MIVSELIEILKTFDPELEVVQHDSGWGDYPMVMPEVISDVMVVGRHFGDGSKTLSKAVRF